MVGTSHEWLTSFAALTQTNEVRNLHLARALRGAGLYTKPEKGNAHWLTRATPFHIANFLLAQASGQASDAVEDVRSLREMAYRGSELPRFGRGTFGDVFDRLIEGHAEVSSEADKVISVQLPNEIRVSTNTNRPTH